MKFSKLPSIDYYLIFMNITIVDEGGHLSFDGNIYA